jgi:spore germination cell wall hydrolase CwlJ-like protein
MSFFGKPLAVAVSAVALSGAAVAPLGFALAAGSAEAHQAPQASQPIQIAALAATPTPQPAEALVVEQPAAPEADDIRDGDLIATPDTAAPVPARPELLTVDAELACLAKVVVHEAGNQSRDGQMAVAQVVMNRVNDSRGRFGRTICGVIMQRGQFFNVHAYNPPRNARWHAAVQVAREARNGSAEPVMEGALFFHAAYANMSFRGRTRIGRLGGHIFYR